MFSVSFLPGNAETLKHEPKRQKINVYKRLREFWKRYYSAHYMTLAVQSKGMCAKPFWVPFWPFSSPCTKCHFRPALFSHREVGHTRRMGAGDLQ